LLKNDCSILRKRKFLKCVSLFLVVVLISNTAFAQNQDPLKQLGNLFKQKVLGDPVKKITEKFTLDIANSVGADAPIRLDQKVDFPRAKDRDLNNFNPQTMALLHNGIW
jgi:hypothetical protein